MTGVLAMLAAASLFTEVTREAGVDFLHLAGAEGKYRLPEIMAAGGAFLDFDGDGDLDIYLVQSGPLPGSKEEAGPPGRLYRQGPGGKFTDVTSSSGLAGGDYGTGVAVGDFDNDGRVDLFAANYGPDQLYRNLGGGKFENVTRKAGIVDNAWSASAVFCDYDADGFLDLYVTHYVKDEPKACVAGDGSPDYCSPQSFSYERHALYHNDGDGTFTDVSRASGVASIAAPGLGVLCVDLTGDGRPDFYAANDGEANQLWVNQGNGTFVDEAFLRGAAVDGMGRPEASMGVVAGDIDSDLDLDLFMTHIQNQTNTLYVNDGKGGFEDLTAPRGLAVPSVKLTGFGAVFFDFDHDGDLDIAVVNGRVRKGAPLPGAAVADYWKPYAEPSVLLENDGTGKFLDVSAKAGDFASRVEVGKGLALGDFDGDGDLDLLTTATSGPARLFRNDAPKKGRWLLVRPFEPARKRDSHGALITVTVGGRKYLRVADPAFSYLSANDPRAHFGIPDAERAESIEVRWPDGTREEFPGGPLDRVVTIEKGRGRALR
jgi:hypothetical protein